MDNVHMYIWLMFYLLILEERKEKKFVKFAKRYRYYRNLWLYPL